MNYCRLKSAKCFFHRQAFKFSCSSIIMSKFFHVLNSNVKAKNVFCDCEIYNLDELKKRYNINSSTPSGFLSKLIELKGMSALEEIDGIYSLAYSAKKSVFLARDIIGIKPLWYSAKNFAFASLRNDLEKMGCKEITELDPRKILRYSIKDKKISFLRRPFFSIKETNGSEAVVVKNLSKLFVAAVKKRIPKKRFGILFSGGIDSTLIALVCKKQGYDFTCYVSHFSYPGIKESDDLVYARKVAKALKFNLKTISVDLNKTKLILKKLIPFLGPDVVKLGVALPLFAACGQAKKDGCDVVFSGLGSEELFAGYLRHKLSKDINKECLSGLLNMHDRDTYRDYAVAYLNKLSMEAPFLDTPLISYSLNIPSRFKLKDGVEKFILRQVGISLGIPDKFAFRKKKAAQYGSNADKALGKLAKKNGFKYKKDYLNSLMS